MFMSAGQMIVGASWSRTSMEKLQAAVLPLVSWAVQVTLTMPFAKIDPEGGEQETVAPGQLSDTAAL